MEHRPVARQGSGGGQNFYRGRKKFQRGADVYKCITVCQFSYKMTKDSHQKEIFNLAHVTSNPSQLQGGYIDLDGSKREA